MWDPIEGHLDPYGTTHAYAKSARIAGAEIYLHNRVTELVQNADGSWNVVTEQGTIHAEHVVNAGGLWAREIGRMVGLELPVLAMEHHYILTEDMPEVAEINRAPARRSCTPSTSPARSIRARSAAGLLLGTYEKAADAVVAEGDAVGFRPGSAARPTSTASRRRWRSASSISRALQHTGIRKIVNGPFTFSPDGNPLVGPVRGLKNFWCACAVMAGFSQGGGVGLALSNWMVDGDPGFDVWAHGRRPLRAVGDARLHQRQGARELFAPLPHPLPQRGAAGGAADADDAAL